MWSYRGAKFLFKKIFGPYFQYELDKDQFDIGFKSGTIDLSNLELNIRRINADLQGSPLALSSGFVGNIHAKVPYTSLWDSPSEFNISNLELSFVSYENYEDIVLGKLNDIEYQQHVSSERNHEDYIQKQQGQHSTSTSTSTTTTTSTTTPSLSSSSQFEHTYYSDEDEEVDNMTQTNRDHSYGGLEMLSEILKKIIDKVSVKLSNCNITITHYDKKLNKSIVLLLLVESVEYATDSSAAATATAAADTGVDAETAAADHQAYFYKQIKLINLSIKVAETEGNILLQDQFYTSSIVECINPSAFQTIFTNRREQTNAGDNAAASTSSPPHHEYIGLKIKRNEKNNSMPLFNINCIFNDFTIVLSPAQLNLLQHFGKVFKSGRGGGSGVGSSSSGTIDVVSDQTKDQGGGNVVTTSKSPTSGESGVQQSPPQTQQQQQQRHFNRQPYNTDFFLLHLNDLVVSYKQSHHAKNIGISITKFNLFQHVYSPSCSESCVDLVQASDNHILNPSLHPIIQFHNVHNHDSTLPFDINVKLMYIYQPGKKSYDRDINVQMKDLSLYVYPYLLVSGMYLLEELATHGSRRTSLSELELKEKSKFDKSSPIIRSSHSYENILTELNSASNNFTLDGTATSSGGGGGSSHTLDHPDNDNESDEESTSTQLRVHSSLIKVIVKFPNDYSICNDDNPQRMAAGQSLRAEFLSIVANNVVVESNIIKDIKDVKWLVNFDDIHSSLTNEVNDSVRFIDVQTKDPSSPHGHVMPVEVTIRGMISAYTNYDVDLNSPPYRPSRLNSSSESPPCSPTSSPNSHRFNPLHNNRERYKGPFSSFIATSEGIFDNNWLGEAEQDEISSFRHMSIESSKYVLNVVIPYLKLEIKKDDLNLLVSLLDSFSAFIHKRLSQDDASSSSPQQPNDIQAHPHPHPQAGLSSSSTSSSALNNKAMKNMSLCSVLMNISRGQFILIENSRPPPPSPPSTSSLSDSSSSLSSSSPSFQDLDHFKYTIDFKRLEVFNVTGYFGRDISFTNASMSQVELIETNLLVRDSKPRVVISNTLSPNKIIPSQSLSIVVSINNDHSNYLDPSIDGKVMSLVFKGVTVEHRINSTWYSRITDFLSFNDPKNNNKPNSDVDCDDDSAGMKTFLNFIDCSLYYIPSPGLSSAAVFFFADFKLKIVPNSTKISCSGQNSNIFVIDDVLSVRESSPTTSSHSSVFNYWKFIGFEPAAALDYFEFEVLRHTDKDTYPKFLFKFNHNMLEISACADSFFVLNEVISNLLGLDIPYAEVADLIIMQGIAPDLKDNIDILINEDTFKSTIAELSQATSSTFAQSPPVNYSSSTTSDPPNMVFEDFEDDDALSFDEEDSSESEGVIYEYHSPDLLTQQQQQQQQLTDSMSSLDDHSDVTLDTSSQTSSIIPIMGSVMIEDYDQDKQQPPQQQQQHIADLPSEEDQMIFVDFEQDSDFKPEYSPVPTRATSKKHSIHATGHSYSSSTSTSSWSSSSSSHYNDVRVSWLDPRYKDIDIIENYISSPGEDPEDCKLPPTYPRSVERYLFSKMNICLKIYKGNDWDTVVARNKSTSTTSSGSGQGSSSTGTSSPKSRDTSTYVEFQFSGFNLRIDKFEETERIAKLLSFHLHDITIIDHVPTSLWNKFLCSDSNVTRFQQSPMLKIQLETVRPDVNHPLLQENKLKVLILPLCFNIDQDTVMFMINFFSYKPTHRRGSLESSPYSESPQTKKKRTPPPHMATSRSIPEDKARTTDVEAAQGITYFQSVEIHPIRLNVDYKPKKMDYLSLTSGNYSELLNLLPLEGAIFNLNRLKLSGVGGWDALFNQISRHWVPHIINTQLMGYVSGVRGINSLVHVGESLANLVIIPMEQYRKDGKVFKGLRKGTASFLKNLTLETLSVGAKMAVGTQGLLETADSALSSKQQQQQQQQQHQQPGSSPQQAHREQHTTSTTTTTTTTTSSSSSKFSDQPVDTKEGIQHAYESVSREIKSAAHTIIAVPMKEYHKKGTKGYMKSMVKAVPIAIIRPMIGITEGVSKTLLGVRNQIDPQKKAEMDNKYKKGVSFTQH
ncbi:hypothetical protein SAMD00019534_026850 [Acytostelium subglobosum LB1]|uniref:hypothetical protein n=1 Tax=Acytostelium subglobosum LB1 TaxID=1410327 RepID=UPI0006449DD1|nr:hypothetical protein SAMD00019534_026850 [Acytostelium subglobosum LB1]GAM19510.1 hypothetical protein SAMD00019534_026850 [Acytostelium subglobosum LB1]|eukprot:XP_012757437.1 hypothetical protein SAMD00019534_026850 [Acytostelium subglobosum LB1]